MLLQLHPGPPDHVTNSELRAEAQQPEQSCCCSGSLGLAHIQRKPAACRIPPIAERRAIKSHTVHTTPINAAPNTNPASRSPARGTTTRNVRPAAATTATTTACSARGPSAYTIRRKRHCNRRDATSSIAKLGTTIGGNSTANSCSTSFNVACRQMGVVGSLGHDQRGGFGHKFALSGDGFGYNGPGHAESWVRVNTRL